MKTKYFPKIQWTFILFLILIYGNIYSYSQTSVVNNSVVLKIPTIALNDASTLNSSNCITSIQYLDGLGRNNVTTLKSFTSSKKDLVSIKKYDNYSRVSEDWLPVSMNATSIPDVNDVVTQAKGFYNDQNPYTTITNGSDMNTELEDGTIQAILPGTDRYTSNKTKKIEILTNLFEPEETELKLRIYEAKDDKLFLKENPIGFLGSYINKYTDEDNHISYIFKDAHNNTLLYRKIDAGVNYDTYYVYNEQNQLCYVLSPEASDRINTAGSYSLDGITGPNDPNNVLAQYAYVYKYDENGRCVAKKLPGKDWIKMIYDNANHLIFTQDGNQRQTNQWTFIKYDIFDRIIQSGTTVISDEITMRNTYDNLIMNETYQMGSGYTSNSPMGTNTTILTQNFYDSYNFISLPAYASIKSLLGYVEVSGFDTKYSNIVNGVDLAPKGMLTGKATAMLDNSVTLVTSLYYNENGQMVQSHSNNHLGGYDHDYFKYNFLGSISIKNHIHKTPYVTADIIENYRLSYDHANRLTSVRYKFNTQPEIVMDSLLYDEVGRVRKKILHGGLQNINYAYNLNNQLKSISSEKFTETLYYQDNPYGNHLYNGNISALNFGSGAGKTWNITYDGLNRFKNIITGSDQLFTEEISNYDKNGNIRGLKRSGYLYTYGLIPGTIDDLSLNYSGNMIKSVSDNNNQQNNVYTSNDFVDKQNPQYPIEYLYDANGNLTANLNKGIAWIKYNLLNLPQKIQFSNYSTNEYVYDAAGIKRIAKYNYSTSTSLIPLGATSTENTASSTYQQDFCGNYVYQKAGTSAPRLQYIITPEGFLTAYLGSLSSISNWKYNYLLKDHQNNTRYMFYCKFGTSVAVEQVKQVDYYPSGLEESNSTPSSSGPLNSSSLMWLFSGNVLDATNGLKEYDFNARWLDNVLFRFTTPDPLAELHYDESPYAYCGNDPINRRDPLGLAYFCNGTGMYWSSSNEPYEDYEKKRYYNIGDYVDIRVGNYIRHYKPGDVCELEEIKDNNSDKYYNLGLYYLISGYNTHTTPASDNYQTDDATSEQGGGNKSSYLDRFAFAVTETCSWIGGNNIKVMYTNDVITDALRTSPGIKKAYEDYLTIGKTRGHYDFGLKGLWNAGSDPVKQFVGSFNYEIINIDGTLQFTVTNQTSFASASYHLWPYKWNWNSGPMSNFTQIYIFTYSDWNNQ